MRLQLWGERYERLKKKYIREREKRDKAFAGGFEKGHEEFKT